MLLCTRNKRAAVIILQVASKVGPDFLYRSQITHPPETIEDGQTTEFFADFTQGEERILKAGNICAPIEPEDIHDMEYELGLAVGIACEVLPETLKHMVDVSRYVVVDVQVCMYVCSLGAILQIDVCELLFTGIILVISFFFAGTYKDH